MGAYFQSNPPAPTVSNVQCGIGSDGDCTANKYGQFKLDPAVTYYLVLQNTAASAENAVLYMDVRDAATCTADGVNTTVYSDSIGKGVAALAPEALQEADSKGSAAACMDAGLTSSCSVAGI